MVYYSKLIFEVLIMNYCRRLPLEGLNNARDLGGYSAACGRVTRYAQFVRCEVPRAVTQADIDYIIGMGITTSIDFRGDSEVERMPSLLAGANGIDYRRSPTFNAQVAFGSQKRKNAPPMDSFVRWGEKYIEMADGCKPWVKETLEMMAKSEGAVIYNCTTGKDRTGMISALLLGLAGVSEDDIIADYCVSEIYLSKIYAELLEEYNERYPTGGAGLADPFFRTEPVNMAMLLLHLNERYGGIESYVTDCGVTQETVSNIRSRLIGD